MNKETINKLQSLDVCSDAIKWVRTQKNRTDAWRNCERADWMLWLIGRIIKTIKQRKKLVIVACQCARTALKYVPEDEKRPLKAIQITEAWANNDPTVTLGDVRNAGDAAYATDAAAYAATYAVCTADAAAYAATYAAYAAYAAGADYEKAQKSLAEIVRKYYPNPPRI